MPENKYELPQVSIRMVKERPLYSEEPMNNPEAAIRVMNEFLRQQDRELACIINLQSDLRPISMNVVSMGALNEAAVHPREIMKSAILSNAASIMLIHNHPSGSLNPSKEDIQMTDRIQQVGDLMGIPLIDHIIVGKEQEFYSFHEKGIVPLKPRAYSKTLDDLNLQGSLGEQDLVRLYREEESNPVKNDRVQTKPLPKPGKDIGDIMESLEKGVEDFLQGDQGRYKEFLQVMSKFHHYSINNTLLIAMQRPDATYCNSYKRWQSLGRQVRRGEKGITIIAPVSQKTKQMKEKLDQNHQPMKGPDGQPLMEEVEVVLPRFKATTIFAYEQTEGEPLPLLIPDELTASVENFEIFMEAIRKVSPVPIRFDEIDNGAKGYYSNQNKEIVIQKGMSESQTMKTAIHECAHSLLHDKDIMADQNITKDRMTKEIEAESCAFCVCAAFNLDTSDYSFPYISGWSKEHDTKELKSSLNIIRTTSGDFIDQLTEKMQELRMEKEQSVSQNISFYVAECMEFPVLGEYHDGLTLDQAIEAFEKIPADRMNGIKGIGFDLQDGSFYSGQCELFSGTQVKREMIDAISHYRESPLVQSAIHKMEKYAAQKRSKSVDTKKEKEQVQEQKAEKPHKRKEAMEL